MATKFHLVVRSDTGVDPFLLIAGPGLVVSNGTIDVAGSSGGTLILDVDTMPTDPTNLTKGTVYNNGGVLCIKQT